MKEYAKVHKYEVADNIFDNAKFIFDPQIVNSLVSFT